MHSTSSTNINAFQESNQANLINRKLIFQRSSHLGITIIPGPEMDSLGTVIFN